MVSDDQEDATIYNVVVNHEEQYSIWPAELNLPLGWQAVEKSGLKADCLAYIEDVWTDMRPLSLRKKMEEAAAQNGTRSPEVAPSGTAPPEKSSGDELVHFLSQGDHPVEIDLRSDKSAQALKARLDLGDVHIKFTNTKGGTELGVKLDDDASDLSQANFDTSAGSVHLVGELTLNDVKVRCIADIDISTLIGTGHLELVEE